MEEINMLLLEGEKILWHRNETENLVYFVRNIIIFIIISLIFLPFLRWIFHIEEIFITVILTIGVLLIDGLLSGLAVYNYVKRRNRLHLGYKQLKNYEQFDIITNKRYIRRHYYLNYKVDISRYLFEQFIEKIDDVVFLNLENIKGVIVAYHIKEITFILEDEPSMFSIKDLDMDLKDLKEALKVLKQLLNL